MAVASGLVSGVTSGAAVRICSMGESGALITVAGGTVALGGPGVTATTGPLCAVNASTPLFVPGARTVASVTVPAGTDNTSDLYAIAVAGPATVTFLSPQGG
jgi:hypothetical protein